MLELSQTDSQISKLQSIKYFTPARSIAEANSILPKVEEIVEKYAKTLMTWKRENDTIQHASDLLWDLARVEVMKQGCKNTWDSAWNYAWKEASSAARNNYGWYGSEFLTVRLLEMQQEMLQNMPQDMQHLNQSRKNLVEQIHLNM